MAQLGGHCPTEQKVAGSIPGQGACLGCGFSPQSGRTQEASNRCFSLTSIFLSLFYFLPSPLSKNKLIKSLKKKKETGKRRAN